MIRSIALAAMMIPAIARADCNPPGSPLGSAGCAPVMDPPQSADMVMIWRPSAFPGSFGTIQAGNMSAAIVPKAISAAGNSQGTATPVSPGVAIATTVPAGGGVILGVGHTTLIDGTTTAMLVYPPAGGSVSGFAGNAAVSIVGGGSARFSCNSAGLCVAY